MSKLSKRERQLQRAQQGLQQNTRETVIAQRSELRIGPLPQPDELAAFETVVPGLAERIVRMAEENGVDRRRTNRTIRYVTILGQVFAFIVVMTALIGGFYLVNQGQDVAGIAAIITAIAAPLAVFTYNHTRRPS